MTKTIPIFTDFTGQGAIPKIGGKIPVFVMPYYSNAEIQALIDNEDYVPVATHAELNAVRTTAAATFGSGTQWAGTYTGGLDKKYVQVRNIDLYAATRSGGAYDNSGQGWSPIGTFTGTYDGAGRRIEGMYINRPATNNVGLFGYSEGSVKNIYVSGDITGDFYVGMIAGYIRSGANVENCISVGFVNGNTRVGGLVGLIGGSGLGATIKNSTTACSVIASNHCGGALGQIWDSSAINVYAVGHTINKDSSYNGGFVGRTTGTNAITQCFYNSDIASGSGSGTPLTTAELLALTAALTTWDTNIWKHGNGSHYPFLKAFNKLSVNMPPPENPTITSDIEGLLLKWDAPLKGTPSGYNVYMSVEDKAWRKANDAKITVREHHLANAGYGYLYNFYAIDPATNGGKSIAPAGWHVPTDAEWKTLEMHLGMSQVEADKINAWRGTNEGIKVKSARTTTGGGGIITSDHPRWAYHINNNYGTNESGFTDYPTGTRVSGVFVNNGLSSYWWSTTENGANVITRWLRERESGIHRGSVEKDRGYPIRLIRDNDTGWTEGEQVTDADGNVYDTIKIGTQIWMLQNLVTTKYSDGDPIDNVTDDAAWAALTTGAYCAYNNDETLAKITDLGTMNLFIKAVYTKNGVDSETGNSETTIQNITI